MIPAGLALRARNVQMAYEDPSTRDSLLAIEHIDVDIPVGQFVSIVGPSGCGKSTFLKVVNGLLPASAGEIELARSNGRPHAMVFQDSALFPWYSVLANVAYGLICRGVPAREARERAMPLIELVGLTGFESRYPYQLSGGMQQRANLARALAVDPEILLMDEPFAALDEITRDRMAFELMRIWNHYRKTVLFVTHSLAEAVFLSDRVVLMSARPGRIHRVFEIDLPRPRDRETRLSEQFHRIVGEVNRELYRVMS